MNKKLILTIMAVGILVLAGVMVYKNFFSWKTYTNDAYGFEFKYPEIYNVLSKDEASKKYIPSSSQAREMFITNATAYKINNIGREYSGIWVTVSDKKIAEPPKIVSEKEISIDGNKGIEYDTLSGMENTQVRVVLFQKSKHYYSIEEWTSQSFLDDFIEGFRFIR